MVFLNNACHFILSYLVTLKPLNPTDGWQPSLVDKITWQKSYLLRSSWTLSECLTNSVVVHNVPWPKVTEKWILGYGVYPFYSFGGVHMCEYDSHKHLWWAIGKLDLFSRLKGLLSMTDWLHWSEDDRYYAMLCSHYTMLWGGGGGCVVKRSILNMF